MRDGQIERLLGGYATNTLTESERQALFEAALDDQELFNALQDEQALRDLLEDSGSRRMLERAAQEPRPEPVRNWWVRPLFAHTWAWGLAGCAAAAGALIFLLGPFGPPHRTAGEIAVLKAPASIEPAPPPAPLATASPETKTFEQQARTVRGKPAKKNAAIENHRPEIARSYSRDQLQASADALPPAAPPAALPPATQAPAQALGGGEQAQRVLPHVASFPAGIASAVRTAAIPYSVLRRAPDGSFAALSLSEELQAGDSVRLTVRPPASGSLTLFEQNTGGSLNTIQTLQVTGGNEYTVPQTPIQVNGAIRLRLVMTPVEGAVRSEVREAAKQALSRPKQRLKEESAAGAPASTADVPQRTLTTEITLVPGKAMGR